MTKRIITFMGHYIDADKVVAITSPIAINRIYKFDILFEHAGITIDVDPPIPFNMKTVKEYRVRSEKLKEDLVKLVWPYISTQESNSRQVL